MSGGGSGDGGSGRFLGEMVDPLLRPMPRRRAFRLALGALAGGALGGTGLVPGTRRPAGATPLDPGSCGAGSGSNSAAGGCPAGFHGGFEQRGQTLVAKKPHRDGRFGRMFKHLSPFSPSDELLVSLAASMEQPNPVPFNRFDNPDIPAGFTFFGQFVDHDITLDLKSDLEKQQDPDGVSNFRTPIYDLDSVYAGGPSVSPDLYYGPKLRLGYHHDMDDLDRGPDGLARIIEARNDENAIVCQLQIAFIKFHNRMVEHVQASGTPADKVFSEAQRLAQWHYQWVVLTEFLPHIAGQDVVDSVLKKPSGRAPIRADLRFYKPKQTPFIPVEFSVAAYRFGHSQVRPSYRMNDTTIAGLFQPEAADTNLNGFRPLRPQLKIDWRNFFPVPGSTITPQRSMQIDTNLSAPLFQLPFGTAPFSLAERNLRRGKALGLPSGQAVAAAMGAPVLTNEELGLTDPGWSGEAPLWFYILKEAELQQQKRRLGAVGGRIVAETLVGLLAENRNSFLRLGPQFRPEPPIAPASGQFTMGDLLRFAGAA